jgi:hypothetical protein
MLLDAKGELVTGRAALATFDDVLKSWRSNGGDQMRADYEQAYAATKKA